MLTLHQAGVQCLQRRERPIKISIPVTFLQAGPALRRTQNSSLNSWRLLPSLLRSLFSKLKTHPCLLLPPLCGGISGIFTILPAAPVLNRKDKYDTGQMGIIQFPPSSCCPKENTQSEASHKQKAEKLHKRFENRPLVTSWLETASAHSIHNTAQHSPPPTRPMTHPKVARKAGTCTQSFISKKRQALLLEVCIFRNFLQAHWN